MLNTNQSNRKNIWKVVLILPIIVGFIYLFQVEVVAQEKKVKFKKETATNQSFYIFESHYDDSYIKSNIADIEKKHNLTITLKDIKRNSENKIIGINLTVDNKKGKKMFHVVNRNSPIDNFAIKIINKNNEEFVEIVGKENLFYPMGTMRANGKIDSVKVAVEETKNVTSEKSVNVISNLTLKSDNDKTIGENFKDAKKDPLFIVNGKEMRRSEIVHKSIITEGETTIYNEKEGLEKFGEKGKDGVYVLNGKTTFTDKEELLKTVPDNPEKKYFLLANGYGCVLFNGYMLKIPGYPSVNLSDSKNKVFIDDRQFHKDMFYNYEHKNLKSVNVLKEFKDDVLVGYSVYFTTK